MFEDREYFSYIDKGDLYGAQKYAIEHTPDYLYKFYSLSDGKTCKAKRLDKKKLLTLERNQSWFDLSKNQNDPLDMRMAYVDERENVDYSQINLARELLSKSRDCVLLSSFGDTNEYDLPMWQFYANAHQGYCIKYKITKKHLLWKVMYSEDRLPVLSIPLNLLHEMKESDAAGKETFELQIYRHYLLMLMCAKHTSWKQEKEYRVLYPAESDHGQNISNELIGIVPEALYIGMNCCKGYKKKLKGICLNALHCNCYQAFISETKILDFQLVE